MPDRDDDWSTTADVERGCGGVIVASLVAWLVIALIALGWWWWMHS